MSLVRTWTSCRTRQIGLLARLLTIRFRRMARGGKRLPVRTIHGRWLSHTTPNSMRRDKSLRLGRDGREDAVLVEPHAIRAAPVICGLETRASNLCTSEWAEEEK